MRGYQSLPPAVEACGEWSLCVCAWCVCVCVGVCMWVWVWCGCVRGCVCAHVRGCVGVGELVAGALLNDMAVSDNTAKLRSCG